MSYLVLARKYRPRTFADVVGQQPVVRALANALDNERLHHAYLFTGTRGVGKTTLARILAACFNCETGVTSTPCGECGACVAIAAGRFIDLIEVDAASRTGVDDTRELLNNAQFLPAQGRCKVYLIDEVHMLTGHSFNALLKTLEEPPEHVKFLLATTEAKKIPVTVLSRCLQFNLKNMLPEVIEEQLAKVLTEESIEAEPAALAAIARAANGSMRDALSITDQAIAHGAGSIALESVNDMLGVAGRDEVGALLEALAKGDSAKLLAAGDDLSARSLDLAAVLGELQRAFHDLAIAAELDVEPSSPFERFKGAFAAEDLQLCYQIALLGGRDLEFAPDAKVGFDMTLIRLASFEPSGEAAKPAGSAEPSSAANRIAESDTSPPLEAQQKPTPRQEPPRRAVVESRQEAPPAAPQPRPTPNDVANQAPPKAPATTEAPAITETPAAAKVPEVVEARTTEAQRDEEPRNQEQHGGKQHGGEQHGEHWHELVAKMDAQGVAAMILQNSNLLARDAERWVLKLGEGHQSLLNDARRQEIAELAAQVEGHPLQVDFEIGELDDETPALHKERQQAERQAKARAALMNDANVQALLQDFDGRLESAQLHQSPDTP